MTSRQLFWAVFRQIGTAQAHKLLFSNFRSKFWRRHLIQWIRFPKREQ